MKQLIDPKLISTENVIRMYSTDSFMPEQEVPSISPSQETTAIQSQQKSISPSLHDSQGIVESRLVLTTPLPKSTSLSEHQTTLVRRSNQVTQPTTKAKELLEY